jgi:hypothetical protein
MANATVSATQEQPGSWLEVEAGRCLPEYSAGHDEPVLRV